jgi:hypothetical protein
MQPGQRYVPASASLPATAPFPAIDGELPPRPAALGGVTLRLPPLGPEGVMTLGGGGIVFGGLIAGGAKPGVVVTHGS